MGGEIVAVVPARCGSKGVPDKNVARVGGRSLLELAVAVGMATPRVDRVLVSTDSPAYEAEALAAGAESLGLRPAELAGDNVKTVDVILDLVERLLPAPETIVLLQPTAPLRSAADISACLELLEAGADAACSVCRLEEPHPYKLKRISAAGLLEPFIDGTSSEIPRQQLPPAYRLNGAVYAVRTHAMQAAHSLLPPRTAAYEMACGINVDTVQDLTLIQAAVASGEVVLP